jgi:RNA polymerase sigma-70 factor (ECF subfamily)
MNERVRAAAEEAEKKVLKLRAAGDLDGAFKAVLDVFGGEIGGFIGGRLHDGDRAADAFALFCEDVWRGLPQFRAEASLRTWLYVIARRAAIRVVRDRQREARDVPLEQGRLIDRLAAEVRHTTTQWKKTAVKDRLQQLREHLSEDERELLILRVDRDLSWQDIAVALNDDVDVDDATGAVIDAAAQKKQVAALRKRFERLKERIRQLATADGLLEPV